MNSLPRNRAWFFATVTCVIGWAAHPVLAQNFYVVGKSQWFVQTSALGAVADPNKMFEFSASAATSVVLTLPAGGTQTLPFRLGDGEYGIERSFATKAALDAAFPNGTYRLTGAGIPAISFNLTADAYPVATPQVIGGTWNAGGLLVVDPTQNTTINFSTFTGYATTGVAGHQNFEMNGVSDRVELSSEIVTQAFFGLPVATTPFTSFTIPAGRLTSGRAYWAELSFDTLTTLDTTSAPGAGAVGIFYKSVKFYIAAQTAGTSTPPPVIVNQPANQTGVVGGTAVFDLNVSVGGSGQFSNFSSRWSFNGQELNVDGAKYSSRGFGLMISNLTAADAGSYTVTLVNAGGIVTSLPATLTLAAPSAPLITAQPVAKTVSSGSTAVFAVAVSGVPAPSYQWRKDGVNVPGGTRATLVVQGATTAAAGAYTVFVNNASGSATSAAGTLTVTNTSDPGRLINLSVLTDITVEVPSFTVGTVVGGIGTNGTKGLVVRAAGPALGALGVPGTLGDPKLDLFAGQTVVASNDNWNGDLALTAAMASVGAFPYAATTSKDAAIYNAALPARGYTVVVSGVNGSTGTAIAEIYDATPAGTFTASNPRLINLSVLKEISAGGSLTLGFTIGGATAKTVLIRAIGPGLAAVGLTSGTLADPQLTLHSTSAAISSNDDWGADPQLAAAGSRVGAFAINNAPSRDAMLIITLPAGGYSARVTGGGDTGGLAIVEVYEVP